MINELYIYERDSSLFKQVLLLSTVMQGHYHISPNYGNDLNADNLEAFMKDPAYGMMNVKEYPLSVLITPRSRIVKFNGTRWEEFVFSLFFLTPLHQVSGSFKMMDDDTLSSGQHIWFDWEDMKIEAMLFLDRLKETIRTAMYSESVPLRAVLQLQEEGAIIERVTKKNNDRLNGASISFIMYAKTESCAPIGTVQPPNMPAVDGLFLLMRFRVDAEGAPMTSSDTELQHEILRGKRVIVFANGTKLDVDDGSGTIDFSDGVERHIIKHRAEDKITFYGGVSPREIITIYQEKEYA